MKSQKWLATLLAFTLMGSMALSACGDNGASSSGGSESGSVETFSKPTITVTPDVVEINAGDTVDLLFGVSVSDEYDGDTLQAYVADDDGFSNTVEGTYTITYEAENSKGEVSTATRTITVNKPLPNVMVEVPYEKTGKWSGTTLTFLNKDYHALEEDTSYTAAYSGIYHNVSADTIVVDIVGAYGEVAILNEHGELVEGRDGANNHLVNAENPNRTTGPNTFTYESQSYGVQSDCARYMQIPARGMAIVVFQDYAGTGYDNDGRGFLCQNLIRQYGLVASVYLNDGESPAYTTYRNQAPAVEVKTPVSVTKGAVTQDDVDTLVKENISIVDDNGTFSATDDATSEVTVAITSRGDLDVNVAGEYTYVLTATDADGKVTTFTRLVKVVLDTMTVKFGDSETAIEKTRVAVNTAVSSYENYDLLFYTNAFTGTITANTYGVATIIDATGAIVRVYDGANGKYLDAENLGTSPAGYGVTGILTSSTYLQMAFDSLQDGEIMLHGPNNTTKIGRQLLLNNRLNALGRIVTITGITIA